MSTTFWMILTVLLAILISSGVAYISYRNDNPMFTGLTFTSVGVTGNLLVRFADMLFGATVVSMTLRSTVSILIIAGWVYLIAQYTGNEWAVENGRILAVAAPMAVITGVYWIEAVHAVTGGDGTLLVRSLSAWDLGYTLYSYLLTFVTIVALGLRFLTEPPIYRRRAAILAVAPLPPALIAAVIILDVVPLTTDLTPVGYALTTTIALYGIKQYDLLEIVPLARETTVNNIDDTVIAVTNDGVIASLNDPGKELLSVTDDVVGRDLSDGLGGRPAVVDAVENGDEKQIRVDDRHVKVSLTPIETDGTRLGTVVQLKDVTQEVERRRALREKQERLEKKNEQLDEFASVVSHDIRNPLSIAQGHLDMIAEGGDREESIRAIEEAHERIEHIIDDLLTLARQGQRVAETTDVDFPTLARKALDSTAVSPDAFEFRGPSTVEADPSRLRQLLENLFRNSVDHVGADVAVRIGPLDGEPGFYVEDDGPGIPEADRDRVFEYGYTDNEDGTGLGLSIVESIVTAHDWQVRIAEGTDGGARFEFVTGERDGPDEGMPQLDPVVTTR